jgi:hypothetical protein
MGVRIRVAAVATLLVGIGAGMALLLSRGRVQLMTGFGSPHPDCVPPPAHPGRYICYLMGHPHASLGVAVILVSALICAVLWLLSYRRSRAFV